MSRVLKADDKNKVAENFDQYCGNNAHLEQYSGKVRIKVGRCSSLSDLIQPSSLERVRDKAV